MSPGGTAATDAQWGERAFVELREWSRIDENLKIERLRLANRLQNQLWRYYPQMLEIANDLADDWILDL